MTFSQTLNAKHEILNNFKFQISKVLNIWTLDFSVCLEFRVSDLEFTPEGSL